ncbi:MAG: DUF488 domain-containing protein [Proteobacteria bacterium]|nr:DUF488 domain-containing protein [Pseudomonadota bacterium]MBU4011973.1 DUF488 domain-containing protein [Pseudomonadota bacterium]MBU4068762.1 DUF488 domain-containing protein [Pseudomonadota bacterium]MBU4101498.1 DUF488 domain-containing protein [Pseudomonadota bacterium]MBU4127876.1 DUF488 domain-containing protein [Pseudomonadota bacterium]
MNNITLFTIGYSGFTLNEFIDVLSRHGITAIADVRSVPYSKFKPEYNSDHLRIELKNNGIEYVFLGDLCGARIDANECYVNGKADYMRIPLKSATNSGAFRPPVPE